MSCDLSSLPEGTYHIKAGAFDKAGNNKTISSGDFVIDKTKPNVDITTPSNGDLLGTGTFSVEGTASDDLTSVAEVKYTVTKISSIGGTYVSTVGSGTASGTSSWTFNVSGLADGFYRLKVQAFDAVGNWKYKYHDVQVDTTAPDVAITAPGDGDIVRGTVTIKGTVTDNNPDHYYLVIKDSTNHIVGGPHTVYSANVADYNWDTTGVSDGTYTIDLEARDAAGNKDSGSVVTKTVTVDNTPPTEPTADKAAGDYTGTQQVELSSTDALSGLDKIYYTTDGSTPDISSTEYTGPITVSHDETIKAIAYDKAGNPSTVLSATYGIAPVIDSEQAVTPTTSSVIVTWTTDEPATSRVIYDTVPHSDASVNSASGPSYGYAHYTAEDSNKVKDHSVTVTGLTPGQHITSALCHTGHQKRLATNSRLT